MKIAAWISWLALTGTLQARLADSDEQLFARYGGAKCDALTKTFIKGSPLLKGAQEYIFNYQGWRIHTALLLAKDGKWYVVRERYQRLDSKPMKDYEIQAILDAESAGRHWRPEGGQISLSDQKTVFSFITHAFCNVWRREDGAAASVLTMSPILLNLELPSAPTYEQQLSEIEERKRQQATPSF